MENSIGLIFFTLLILIVMYRKLYKEPKCEKRINKYIEQIGGEVISVKKIAVHEDIYSVKYTIGNIAYSKAVHFLPFGEDEWY